jgi:hypothetical protein
MPKSRSNSQSDGTDDLRVVKSACEESREVLDHLLAVQDDVDDKAIWSVRTAVLVIGLLLSAGTLGNLPQFLTLPWYVHGLAGFGVASLVLSVFLGIGAYTITEASPGISHQRRMEAYQRKYAEHEWQRQLLHGYQSWIDEQETWNERNGYYLFLTHLFLLAGTTSIVVVGAVALFLAYESDRGIALLVGLALPVVAVSLLLWGE